MSTRHRCPREQKIMYDYLFVHVFNPTDDRLNNAIIFLKIDSTLLIFPYTRNRLHSKNVTLETLQFLKFK